MKRLLVLILGCLLLAVSCKNTTESVRSSEKSYPKLKIVNDVTGNSDFWVTKIELVNYKFEPLQIFCGETQTFDLDKGMAGGNKNILVRVYHTESNIGLNIRKNFTDGKTTVIRLTGTTNNYHLE